ncbi:Optic atrophy 3 protein [Phytophthora pseudosyringae]|uniref:Optic atrophy 3 protein n=1 Tax=Phytophthora pseudosyringae TaxID=221518 RepID=A0A8T1WFN9_9STRA|nr:Optic atrophy 3 protein [Phytophthora pseudosyringae]
MLPMIKLGGLVARTLTKPLARVVKARSKVHPLLNAVCGRLGQQQHRLSMQLHMGFRGISSYSIKPLSADQAAEQGADLVGELLIFSVALGAASLEYSRSAASARAKEAQQKAQQLREERETEARFEYLETQVAWLEDRLAELTRVLESEKGARLERIVAGADRQEEEAAAEQEPRAARRARRRQQPLDQNVHVGVAVYEKAVASSVAKVWTSTFDAVAGLFK